MIQEGDLNSARRVLVTEVGQIQLSAKWIRTLEGVTGLNDCARM